jgi:hypothetical protein
VRSVGAQFSGEETGPQNTLHRKKSGPNDRQAFEMQKSKREGRWTLEEGAGERGGAGSAAADGKVRASECGRGQSE